MSKRGFQAKPDTTNAPVELIPYTPTPSWKLIRPSVLLFRKYLMPSLLVSIFPAIATVFASLLINDFKNIDIWTVVGVLLHGIIGLVTLFNAAAIVVLQTDSTTNRTMSVRNMYREAILFWPRIIGFGMLFSLLVVGGLLLLIVPGLIIVRRYILAPYCIVEEDLGIRASMQRSAELTANLSRPIASMVAIILGFSIVSGGASLLPGDLGFYSSLIVTVLPVFYFYLPALRFREAYQNLGRPVK